MINITAIAVVFVLSLLLPIAAWFIVWRRTKASIVNLLVGMGVFFVCFNIAIATSLLGSVLITSPIILTLLLSLRAGLVEEFGRFIAFKWFLKRRNKVSDGLMYGVGHGGMEVLLVYSLAMVNNLIIVFMANTGTIDLLIAMAPEQAEAIHEAIGLLAESSPLMLGIGLFERVSALILHIALSVIVFCAVRQRKWLYLILAIAMHTLTNSTITLYVAEVVNLYTLEGIIFGMSLLTAFIAWLIARGYKPPPEPSEPAPPYMPGERSDASMSESAVALRELTIDDAANLSAIVNNKNIWDNLDDMPFPSTPQDSEDFILPNSR
ncbi:MAG: YhfC family intramembrane metalloprotease [Coriobacteriia bacterium]|nr:YhfC family intramembrane metalloprotease [Coriobacteriia bacterium]